jgi:hypothetical protein
MTEPHNNTTKHVELAVVASSGPERKIVLQDTNTHQFFQGIERWTTDAKAALAFVDANEAQHLCRYLGFSGLDIVGNFDHVAYIEPLHCAA